MIAHASFAPASGRVRTLRFARRASFPLGAACAVANGVRETLRELLGEHCELVIGEPAALPAAAWALLSRDALLFLTRGHRTDVVLVVPERDARRLVLRAFGEGDSLPDGACSALELHALGRIAARCASAFEPLCGAERAAIAGQGGAATPGARAVGPRDVPACAAYFDLRVHAPVALTIGIGVVRDLLEPPPVATLAAESLDDVPLDARVVFAEGHIDAAAFVKLQPGSVVRLDTKVGAPASLNCGSRRLFTGVPGAVATRAAFFVQDAALGAVA